MTSTTHESLLMNTPLDLARSRDLAEHDVLHELRSLAHDVRLIDRMSLRLGLWLLLRGTRSIQPIPYRDAHTRRRSALRAREARELAAQRMAALLPTRP
ncbi:MULTISPECIES: hypothetical protein [Microbacterium]|uniref:Uncharacterized protein n=1 Tax=Microbacterium wangchenii TaxID=2541726 RepID=A0ABX5SW55_9MICO|nr:MULTISPECIES: hypothetical protein [Microbacterium]MCK6065631.1 hypothetical protein [Microbacterium sp. EYE_512]QBR89049.1 hypothetical protein E4K62_10330 [Microbacterium wangchenii]TXK20769.1 hypothetical protein FVP99_03945 [Microbacterium wangchenii]